jgi:hypothetical protein
MLKIKQIDYKLDKDIWNTFANNNGGFFKHTTYWVNFYIYFCADCKVSNKSFMIMLDNKCMALVPLLEITNRKQMLFFDWGNPYPLFDKSLSKNNKDKIEKLIFKEIFKIAKAEDISYINFYVSPLSDVVLNKEMIINPLSKFGFHDTTISTNILKLEKDKDVLFRNFRKGVKSDIKTAIKNGFETKVYDHGNITRKIFDIYKNIHFQAAGRKTRPDKSWDIMFEWIQKGVSILAITTKEDKYISTQFVNVYNKKAYYQSGASKPEYERERGVGHLAQWEIIKYLKSNDITYYELGWNWYPNISQEVASEKMLGISRFKAGFGADIYPLFRGEWFRDKECMGEAYDKSLKKYWENENS